MGILNCLIGNHKGHHIGQGIFICDYCGNSEWLPDKLQKSAPCLEGEPNKYKIRK